MTPARCPICDGPGCTAPPAAAIPWDLSADAAPAPMLSARAIRQLWLAALADPATDAIALAALDAIEVCNTYRALALAALKGLQHALGERDRLRADNRLLRRAPREAA